MCQTRGVATVVQDVGRTGGLPQPPMGGHAIRVAKPQLHGVPCLRSSDARALECSRDQGVRVH